MRFQKLPLPSKENKLGETTWLTEETVLKPILNKHMAPKGKVGLVIVKEGSLDFVWEDTPDDIITGNSYHPIVIEPERYHHVIITGNVLFKIEFYQDKPSNEYDESAVRPGEAFIK
ncbi:hypothetical protein KQ51_01706 [Candidatus Izimaplasma bacterium HR1]|uniref:DUF1971 domain-containing protein n=1 Tax=Candidatus Izimoplasma sp. HR1 TaxID=1541959 RepID=UPI0004F7C2BE|nr:hypothetical protein KQ51_01706 [Candidatus Izimaplasma bacterium HR1]